MFRFITGCGIVFLAGVLTIVGFNNSLGQMESSDLAVAFWFPWAAMIKRLTANDLGLLIAALLQFPLLAAAAIIAGRKFGWKRAIAGVVVAHLTMSLIVIGLSRG